MIIVAAIKVIKDNEECIFMGKRHGNCIEQFAFCNFRMPLFESVQGFAQPYRDFENNTEPDDILKDFARWVNHKATFKTVDWSDYKKR